MFVIELGVPFMILATRRFRLLAFWILVAFQAVIMLTGNQAFFNLLTIALCVLLLDDAVLGKLAPGAAQDRHSTDVEKESAVPETPDALPIGPELNPAARRARQWPRWLLLPLAGTVALVTTMQILQMFHVRAPWPGPARELQQALIPFRSINAYGLFAVMTQTRPEIIIEGSSDGETWRAYEFKYKPGDLSRRPGFVAPHQPRLDWQLWFAALSNYRDNLWFISFCFKLLEGAPDVLALMKNNPFPDKPPTFIRAAIYEYHFTDPETRGANGDWWRREFLREYCPPIWIHKRRQQPPGQLVFYPD